MLSNRFIIVFFIGAVSLAWMIPGAWMNTPHTPVLAIDSPWKSTMKLEDVVWGGGSPYVRISVKGLESPIFLSGWSLENERGERAEIGLGVESFPEETLPVPDRIRVASDTSLLVSFDASPIGVSFREHVCSGYLRGTKPFAPPIEARCPDVSTHPRWASLDGTCQLFLSSLPRCEVTSPEHVADMSQACESFLRTVPTYVSCMKETGKNGSLPTWRIFVPDRPEFIKEAGGMVVLKDGRGMVVDTLSYQTIGI